MTPISVAFSRPEQQPPWEILQELTAHVGDYLLVGAHARNIVCFGMAEVAEAAPRTHDVDIAIAVPRGEGGSRLRAEIDRFRDECQPRPVDVDTPCRNSVPKPPMFRNLIRPFSAHS
ncbi:hypothetical protein [uncultured Microbacterium sp.]|uniref:hypothetical protein n=1 Tax=uncultured Microbacterium sp. TaxID=191216 RepID=UPI0025F0D408|nr:hypothetical protein [uncultured Microbacterium sp.]